MNQQPVFFLDCDDILLDFRRSFLQYCIDNNVGRFQYGVKLDIEQYVASNMSYFELMTTEEFFGALERFGTGGGWRNISALPGASEFTKELRRRGAKVVIVTSVASADGPNRILNLIDEGIEFDEIYFTKGAKKHLYVEALQTRYSQGGKRPLAYFVDDMASTCLEVAANNDAGDVEVVTVDFPYNDAAFEKATRTQIEEVTIVPHLKKDLAGTYDTLYQLLLSRVADRAEAA